MNQQLYKTSVMRLWKLEQHIYHDFSHDLF